MYNDDMDHLEDAPSDGSRKAVIMGLFVLSVVLVTVLYRTDTSIFFPQKISPKSDSQSSHKIPTKEPTTTSVSSESDEIVIPMYGVKGLLQPYEISILQGATVKLTVQSMDGSYAFENKELHLESGVIESGKKVTVSFLADKEGSYQLVASHAPNAKGAVLGIVKIRPVVK